MQFKTEKKEFEITLNGARKTNGYVGAQFKLVVTRNPVIQLRGMTLQ